MQTLKIFEGSKLDLLMSMSHGVMVNKQGERTTFNEYNSHEVPNTSGLVLSLA